MTYRPLFAPATALFILAGSAIAAPATNAAPDRLAGVRSYALYYGGIDDAALDALATYDLVVVHPGLFRMGAEKGLARLHAKGCRILGYLSCFEVADWAHYKGRVPEEWNVRVNGETWRPWGGNRAASLAVPGFRDLLVELVRDDILAKGFDGVFMDTLADLDNPALPEAQRTAELAGLGTFLSALRAAAPGAILVANWTLQKTLPAVAPHVDAVCWENFAYGPLTDPSSKAWMEGIRKRLADEADRHPFRVIALWNCDVPPPNWEAQKAAVRDIADTWGYLFYPCTGNYLTPPAPVTKP